jgi:hypothetical protein
MSSQTHVRIVISTATRWPWLVEQVRRQGDGEFTIVGMRGRTRTMIERLMREMPELELKVGRFGGDDGTPFEYMAVRGDVNLLSESPTPAVLLPD